MGDVKAVLGPTNTGKTHYAIERMLGHVSGMAGFPLRLLAREIYDRLVAAKGVNQCALITGEERIWPKTARYFACTVESMPVDQEVACVVIDEVQLAQHPERGHIFTDRILNLRGTQETLFLGASTMRGLLRDLDLIDEVIERERFSELHYSGPVKITRLPKRSAIVAFSSEDVYALGEVLRRNKGGAAVVMGALSPRTRNAQVELYQSGQVDYIVATDAIGMGLNLDIDHVAFAANEKFDGHRFRPLTAQELAQIAGRAGRFRSDGSFGETTGCGDIGDEKLAAITNHVFEPVDAIMWRNNRLDMRSIKTLIASLARPSGDRRLIQNPNALDEWILRRMAEDASIGPDIRGERVVHRLWDLARLPDFRKAGHEGHAQLVMGLADTLIDPDARVSDIAMEKRMEALAVDVGDIARLQQKLSMVRTWTYAAHRDDWLENPTFWQERTRSIEDAISDALHEALMARFVDRRTNALLAGLKRDDDLMTEIKEDGEINVEGHVVGHLKGLTFAPLSRGSSLEDKTLRQASEAALRPIISRKLNLIATSDFVKFKLNETGDISFDGDLIAKLVPSADWLKPDTKLIGAENAELVEREPARAMTADFVKREISRHLPTHYGLAYNDAGKALEGYVKGLAFQLQMAGAAIDLRQSDNTEKTTPEQRTALKEIGIRLGRVSAHAPDAQKPAGQKLLVLLKQLETGTAVKLAPEGAGSFALDGDWPDSDLLLNGYIRFGKRAVRADLVERLAWEIAQKRKAAEKNAFELPPEIASIISTPADALEPVLKGLGLVPVSRDEATKAVKVWRYGRVKRPDEQETGRASKPRRDGNSADNKQTDNKQGEGRRGENKQGNRPQRSGDNGGKPRADGGRNGPRGKANASGKTGQFQSRNPQRARPPKPIDPDSPFAILGSLLPPPPPPPPARKPKPKVKPDQKNVKATDKSKPKAFVYKPFG